MFINNTELCFSLVNFELIDKDMGHPSRRVITKPVEAMAGGSSGEYDNEGIISVYCAILGAIVLGKLISPHISPQYSLYDHYDIK